MTTPVTLSPAALQDIRELLDYLVPVAGEAVARRYVDEILDFCLSLEHFPLRGQTRDDIAPGLRIVGYHRKASIAFSVNEMSVNIIRIFHRGRQIRFDKE